MNADQELVLTNILRRMLVATDDVSILTDARGLQRKVTGLGLDAHELVVAPEKGRYTMLSRVRAERDGARNLAHAWEKCAKEVLSLLAEGRGGKPPEGYTWRWTTERTDTQEEVSDRWIKRMEWETKQIIRRNANLHAQKAMLEDRVAYLEAAVAHFAGKPSK